MSLEARDRFVVRSMDVICWTVAIFALFAWVATVADHFLRLGWGWEIQNIWISPIVAVGALVTRTLSRVIFRWMGALG